MKHTDFEKLLLKTAFCCMASDGNIDEQEIALLRKWHNEKKLFGEVDLNKTLEKLRLEINSDSQNFLRNYFNELDTIDLLEGEELKVIEIAIDTIRADDKIEYSEIKFFKVIRCKLKIDDDSILVIHPDFEEFLAQDIKNDTHSRELLNDYLNTNTLPIFKNIDTILTDIDTKDRDG
ncbi:TerB family tellurite resistance protein [Bacteroides sp.]|uniref:tellurite resistance TerB family protein n=1 Tax=Bacteroides sp. TaxID=29523 RepID=UPI001B7884E5|nr:TerB family tellurite resistance protein [Bacteroides sp.]MBP6936731.1 TerB family tellurite resistance protein [Bacteroides sp.]MBP9585692.1 TerB family tellurite resistance protein [Bacteroides sp.]